MHYCLEITTEVHLGTTPEERATAQTLYFQVDFDFDATQSMQSDDLKDTLDYQVIYDTVRTLDGQWNLLEKLHHDVITQLKKLCPTAEDLNLQITKQPWPNGKVTVG